MRSGRCQTPASGSPPPRHPALRAPSRDPASDTCAGVATGFATSSPARAQKRRRAGRRQGGTTRRRTHRTTAAGVSLTADARNSPAGIASMPPAVGESAAGIGAVALVRAGRRQHGPTPPRRKQGAASRPFVRSPIRTPSGCRRSRRARRRIETRFRRASASGR